MILRDADELILPAVKQTIAALPGKTDEYAAVIKLCERYAAEIDAAEGAKARAWAIRWIGPLLLDALESLGATPIARPKIKEGRASGATGSRLATLRAAHTAS